MVEKSSRDGICYSIIDKQRLAIGTWEIMILIISHYISSDAM